MLRVGQSEHPSNDGVGDVAREVVDPSMLVRRSVRVLRMRPRSGWLAGDLGKGDQAVDALHKIPRLVLRRVLHYSLLVGAPRGSTALSVSACPKISPDSSV